MWALPGAVASIFGSNIAPVLVRRIRPAYVVSAGLALAGIGSALLTQTGTDSLALAVIGNSLMSLGFGFTFTLTADMVVTAAPPERAGAASAISETGAEFGGALGIAVLGSIGMAIYRGQIAGDMPAGLPVETVEIAKETLGGAVTAAAELGNATGAALATAAHDAFVSGLHIVAVIGAAGFFALALLTVIALRGIVIHGNEDATDEIPSRLIEAEV